MKRTYSIAFCLLMLCSLLLIVNMGTVFASEPGYAGIHENYAGSAVTVDGKWGGENGAEWADAWLEKQFPIGTNARFAYKAGMNEESAITLFWIIEFPDTTNDAGDKWVICIDGGTGEGPDGGTAPNSNDNKIEITGHTTLTVYVGNGTGWAPVSTTAVQFNNTLTTSPYIAANHWVVEVALQKGAFAWGGSPPPEGLFVGMYDASNTTQGWVMWPPTSADNPSRWGTIATYGTEIPENLSVAVIVTLSSVAVIVGSIYLRKRPKTTNVASLKP